MQTFAAITLPELAPILTILAGMLVGFYGLMKFVLNNALKSTNADRDERKEERVAFQAALDNLASAQREAAQVEAESRDKQTQAIERTADEAESRNGHLAEMATRQIEISIQNKDQIVEQIKGLVIDRQTVHNQIVENEKVINKE